MAQIDSAAVFDAQSSSRAPEKQRALTRGDEAQNPGKPVEIQPLPRWVTAGASAKGDKPVRAADAQFFAGAALARLDDIMRSGDGAAEPVFVGALRQRLALRAAAACARIARLREDEGALRDAEHLAGFDAAPTPAGRLHRLWRFFATRLVRHDARFIRAAADCLDLPPDIDCEVLIELLREASTYESPLAAAARVSAETRHILDDASPLDAEILALWLADLILARRLGWAAPLPLLATTITYPSFRTATGLRPRPSDADWSLSVARGVARASREAYALAGELSRRAELLLNISPKLRAKKAARVVDLFLSDDCVSPARAAKAAGISDRAARRLFDRLVALGAVRELSGRPNFRLYGL